MVIVPVVFDDIGNGFQLGSSDVAHSNGLHRVWSTLHSGTACLRKHEQRRVLQSYVAHVRLHATQRVAGTLHHTSSTLDLGKLPNTQIAALLEGEVARGLKAISVAPTTVHLNFLLFQPCSVIADESHTLDHEGIFLRCNSIRQRFPHESLKLLRRLSTMSANDGLTKHGKDLVNVLMRVAHHMKFMATTENFAMPTTWLRKAAAYCFLVCATVFSAWRTKWTGTRRP